MFKPRPLYRPAVAAFKGCERSHFDLFCIILYVLFGKYVSCTCLNGWILLKQVARRRIAVAKLQMPRWITDYNHSIVTREIVLSDKLFVVTGHSSGWLNNQNRIRNKIKIWIFNAIRIGEKTILVFRSFPLYRDMDTVILFTVAFSYFYSFFSSLQHTPFHMMSLSFCIQIQYRIIPSQIVPNQKKIGILKREF